MARGTLYPSDQVHYLTKEISFEDEAQTVTVGYLPKHAVVIGGGVVVTEVFNDGTADVLDIGIDADADEIAGALDLTALGVTPADNLAGADALRVTADEAVVTALYSGTNNDATTGAAVVFVTYVVVNNAQGAA